ncbi:hypothetical protein AVEN_81384-1 [Araneus ventricosus]|uniref:Uncharacterized protein n=1 Tax=Araneus ventricosus TaxID=182803 RepID=A0A4Y2B6F9_ARAVE|nr:hypothetical protein AVEN_81384-1 [Araneus ventricosus]
MTRTTPELAPLSPNIGTTPAGGNLTHYIRFNMQQATYTVNLQWKRVSSLEPSGLEVEVLPLATEHQTKNGQHVIPDISKIVRQITNVATTDSFTRLRVCLLTEKDNQGLWQLIPLLIPFFRH